MVKTNPKPTDIKFDPVADGVHVKELVQRGNQYGVPILISLGGWTGSQTFSPAAADAASRKTFINNAMAFVRTNTRPEGEVPNGWNMDGIDIDWYVGWHQIGLNRLATEGMLKVKNVSHLDFIGSSLDVLELYATSTTLKTVQTTFNCSRNCVLSWTSSSLTSTSI